jgi:hypothetical protein
MAYVAVALLVVAGLAALLHSGSVVGLALMLSFAFGCLAATRALCRVGRRREAFVTGALVVVALSACWYRPLNDWFLTIGWGDRPFVSAVWSEARNDPPDNPRGAMFRSLLREHRLVGLSRDQVQALLGRPDYVDGMWDGTGAGSLSADRLASGREFRYLLGSYSGMRIDPDLLSLRFGANDTVISWCVLST